MTTHQKITQIVEYIKAIVVDNYHPDKIILFGSALNPSKWNENKSDIDIAIIKNTETAFYKRPSEVRNFFWGKQKQAPLDIVVYTQDEFDALQKKSFFVKDIKDTGQIIYER